MSKCRKLTGRCFTGQGPKIDEKTDEHKGGHASTSLPGFMSLK